MISVVCPTVTGREHWLERAHKSIADTTPDFEWLQYENLPTCGAGWNLGIRDAMGEHILLFADDLEAHEGWWVAGLHSLSQDEIPCPRILNPDGTLQSCGTFAEEAPDGTESVVARVPFLTRRMAEAMYPILPNHYMGDHWITWKGKTLGWPTRVNRSMLFTHHYAPEGRIDSLNEDVKAYHRATRA